MSLFGDWHSSSVDRERIAKTHDRKSKVQGGGDKAKCKKQFSVNGRRSNTVKNKITE